MAASAQGKSLWCFMLMEGGECMLLLKLQNYSLEYSRVSNSQISSFMLFTLQINYYYY